MWRCDEPSPPVPAGRPMAAGGSQARMARLATRGSAMDTVPEIGPIRRRRSVTGERCERHIWHAARTCAQGCGPLMVAGGQVGRVARDHVIGGGVCRGQITLPDQRHGTISVDAPSLGTVPRPEPTAARDCQRHDASQNRRSGGCPPPATGLTVTDDHSSATGPSLPSLLRRFAVSSTRPPATAERLADLTRAPHTHYIRDR